MNYKKEIETLLNSLKEKGYNRKEIEVQLNYSENYIDQALAKGGNQRFYKALKKFSDDVLQKTTSPHPVHPVQETAIDKIADSNQRLAKSIEKMVSMLADKEASMKEIKVSLEQFQEDSAAYVQRLIVGQEELSGQVKGVEQQIKKLNNTYSKRLSPDPKH